MSNINKKLFKRLHLNHAYGQLIAMIFVPIMVLACVGAALVLSETSNAAKAQQRQMAIAILTRYQSTAESALDLLNRYPWHYDQAQNALQYMFNEKLLNQATIIDHTGAERIHVGGDAQAQWPKYPTDKSFFGPLKSNGNHVYGMQINDSPNHKGWLLIELDNQPDRKSVV